MQCLKCVDEVFPRHSMTMFTQEGDVKKQAVVEGISQKSKTVPGWPVR